jgi:periplasmic divalent cation tolerance protein
MTRETNNNEEYCVVITTCSTDEEADVLSAALLDKELAACVQIVEIKSHYVWKGERQIDPERLLLIKTRRRLYDDIESTMKEVHPYETPELICLPVVAGLPAYLSWINDVTVKI